MAAIIVDKNLNQETSLSLSLCVCVTVTLYNQVICISPEIFR